MLKRLSGAIALLTALLTAAACGGPDDPQEHLRRGSEFLTQKKYQEAIVELRTAVQIDPRLAEARRKLADAYLATDDVANAIRETVRAADLLPDDAALQVRAGNMLLAAGQFEDADARANRALARDRNSTEALILKGNALANLRNFEGALTQYEQAIANRPGDEQGLLGIGAVQLAQGQRTNAEATFKRAAETNPKSIDARLSLANLFWATRDMAAAERELKAAHVIDPSNPLVNRALGLLHLATKRTAEAEPYLVAYADAEPAFGHITLANYYVTTNRTSDARRVLERAASVGSARVEAATRLAELDLLEGKTAEATKRVDDLLKESPKAANALVLKARILSDQRQYEPALAALRTAIAEGPNAGPAHLQAGSIYEAMGRNEDAIASYEAALGADTRNVPVTFQANLRLGAIHLQGGSLDRAMTYAQGAVQLQPTSANAHLLAARVETARGELVRARGRLAMLEKSFPDSPGVNVLRGQIDLASKRQDSAATAFRKALETDPLNVEALTGLTRLDVSAGRQKDAVARIERALGQGTPSAPLHLVAAQTYLATNELPKAEKSLLSALERDPNRFEAYTMLGELYSKQNRIPEAIKQFETMLARNPKSAGAASGIGVLLQMQGRNADSEKAYERALAIDPRAAVAANNLAWLWVDSSRNLDRALELAQTARQQLPDDADVADTLGWIFVRKQLGAQAIPHLEFSVKTKGNDPVVQYHLGMAYKLVGDNRKARAALERALELNQAFEGSAEARKALTELRG